jgi:hypothetical protein
MHGRSRRHPGPVAVRRRGRTAIVTLLVVWAVTQVALGRAVDASLWLRDPPFGDKEIKYEQRIAARTTPAGRPYTAVFVGSSRTSFGVRGDVVEEAIGVQTDRPIAVTNFGFWSAGPVANMLIVHRLVTAKDKPDFVVIEVLPPLLGEVNHLAAEHPFLSPERLRHDELELAIKGGLPAKESGRRWWAAEIVPEYGLRLPLLSRIVDVWLPSHLRFNSGRLTDSTGWQPPVYETIGADEYERGVRHAHDAYFNLLHTLRFDTAAARAVEMTLADCRRHSVGAALLLMPEGTEFRSWYPPQVEAQMYAFLDGMCREDGVALIDARRWLDDGAFSDSHHLRRAGATEFSARVGRAIAPFVHGPTR